MYRIGYAEDIHPLKENRDLILAGVRIPFPLGLDGHSDADVIYHSIAESILGALALGDLGKHFPDNDDTYKGYDSSKIVTKVYQLMDESGYKINNIDISVILEKPRLAPYIQQMRVNVASLLQTEISNVSIKAGTNEKIDDIGKGLAIKAVSIVMLIRE